MRTLQKGEKLQINKEISSKSFMLALDWDQKNYPDYEIDVSAMLLSERAKLEEEENFIFYNNLKSPNGELELINNPPSNYKKAFLVNMDKISPEISRILLLMTIENGDQLNRRFGNIKNIKADIIAINSNIPALSYPVEGLSKESALIVLEIYKRNNEWRIQANGNGFNAGLSAILKEYGSDKVQVEENKEEILPPNNTKQEEKKVSTINLSKITLEKKGDVTNIDLRKYGQDNQLIHINLNWNQSGRKSSGFIRKSEPIDLDLGCMFLMNDGSKGAVQALGNLFGSKYTFPYIFLDKDDRSGSASDGENMYIYRPDLIKKLIVFTFIYEGSSDFTDANAILTLKGLNQEVTIKLDSPRPYLTFCAGALIENENGMIKIQKIDEYMKNHLDCDKMFGFNFKWVAGSKD